MRYLRYIQNAIVTSIAAVFVATAAVGVSAQNVNREYRDWQNAQIRAQQEQRQYMRTRSRRDYNQWQAAQRRAQEQYRQYQNAVSRNRNNIYYNSGYISPGVTYRVYNNGSYYSTTARGAELLRQAIRQGYVRGYQEGRRDARNRYGYNFGNSSDYRLGTYGYQSYVARNQYRYYFQQGFQRGYEDGYYSRARYGYRNGNSFNILGSVLNTILNLATD
jgi:hypothetical protein